MLQRFSTYFTLAYLLLCSLCQFENWQPNKWNLTYNYAATSFVVSQNTITQRNCELKSRRYRVGVSFKS
jgi:hypothetical protein